MQDVNYFNSKKKEKQKREIIKLNNACQLPPDVSSQIKAIIYRENLILGKYTKLDHSLENFYEDLKQNRPKEAENYLDVHMREMIASIKYMWLKMKYRHFDIKPDNILISDSDDQHPILIDFENPLDQKNTEKEMNRFTYAFASYDINQRKANSDIIYEHECRENEDLLQLGYTFLYLVSDHEEFLKILDPWDGLQQGRNREEPSEERYQEVADRKLDIEAEPNIIKLKNGLVGHFKIDPTFDEFTLRLAKYFAKVGLFDEQPRNRLAKFFDELIEIFE